MTETTDVIQFRKAFGLPIHEKPGLLTVPEEYLHLDLIEEELQELKAALFDRDLQETFDALLDLKYVITGMGVHMGLPMDEGWREVHASNMSKLDDNGEPIYHDGTEGPVGKVKKSENYWPPRLDVVLEMVDIPVDFIDGEYKRGSVSD